MPTTPTTRTIPAIPSMRRRGPTETEGREARRHRTDALLARREQAGTDEDRRAVNAEIVALNREVAVAVAMRYRDRGIPLEDLCQTACVGLTKAVDRFDARLADDLLTYAVPTIRGELQRLFRDQGWVVRPPRRLQELHRLVPQTREELRQRLGRDPSCGEIAERLEVAERDVAEAVLATDCFSPLSLDQPTGERTPGTLGDLLAAEPEDVALVEARVSLAPLMRGLPERDRRILYLRFFEDRTQADIGRELGVSQMQVSRLLSRVLEQLRDSLGVSA